MTQRKQNQALKFSIKRQENVYGKLHTSCEISEKLYPSICTLYKYSNKNYYLLLLIRMKEIFSFIKFELWFIYLHIS